MSALFGGKRRGKRTGSIAAADGRLRGVLVAPPSYRYLVPMHPRRRNDNTVLLGRRHVPNVLNLRHLSNQIGVDRPFYGLRRGLFGNDEPHDCSEMAAAYLTRLVLCSLMVRICRRVLRWQCTALEIARQLRAAGERVALLAMLDTPAPSLRAPLTPVDRAAIQLQDVIKHRLRYPMRWWQNRREWRRTLSARQQVATPDTGMQHSFEIEAAFMRALDNYDVGQYDGEITL